MNLSKQPPIPKLNISKTPQQVFLKKGDGIVDTNKAPHSIEKVKNIDELYSKTFLDEYFT